MDPKTVLLHLELGVAAIAPDWTIVEWNPAAERLAGVARDAVLGRNFWVAFPDALGSHVERALHEVLVDGEPRAFIAPALGTGAMLETRVSRGPANHLILALRPVREDMTPLVQASERERRFSSQLFALLPLPALLLTTEGRILAANGAGAKLFGATEAAMLRGRLVGDWARLAQQDAFARALRDAVSAPQRFPLSLDRGRAACEIEALIQNVDSDGAPQLLFLALDLSREVLLQRKLFQADRLSQLGALVSGVAHELNNPLAAIAAFAEVLKVDADTPDLKESAEVIHLEAMRAGRVVQTLLEFARQRPRTVQAVDLKDVAERVVALHRSALRKARVQATVAIDDAVPAVTGDPQELQQILLNAVVNAEQAIATTKRPGQITIGARRVDDRVVVLIEDTGPGIPREIQERVFEPFFTTKGESGTGLGLAITYGLVKANGGRIYLHNVEGGGARLGIELPIEQQPTPEEAAVAFRGASRALSVLVVDDEESVRRGLTRMAERLGHRVASACDYAEARRQLADPTGFDALLVDVHLDEAHSGFDLFAMLRDEGRGRERHVIFTTGDSMSAKTRDLLETCDRPLLKKPFNLEELREVLDRVGEAGSGKRS